MRRKERLGKAAAAALCAALIATSVLSPFAPSALAASGVEVNSGKSGTESTLGGDEAKLAPFPYGERVKVNDLIHYRLSDFVKAEKGKAVRQAGMDPKANSAPKSLAGSNWYSADSLTYLLERLLYIPPYYGDESETIEEGTEEEMVLNEDTVEEDAPMDEPEASYADGMQGVSAAAPKHSTTNVQVEGVDEADIVKTDGRYIYYLSSRGIAIVEAKGGKPKQVASLKPNAQVGQNLPSYKDLYISGSTLIILAQKSEVNIFQGLNADQGSLPNSLYSRKSSPFVSIDFYDMTNPAQPKLKRQVNIQGNLNSTRLYNGSLYYIVDSNIWEKDALVDILPKYQDSLLGEEYYVTLPGDIYMDAYGSSSSFSTTTMGAISLSEEQAISPKVYERAYGITLYMNRDSLYLAMATNIYPKGYEYIPSPVNSNVKPAFPVRTDASIKQPQAETILARFDLGKNSVPFAAMGRIWGSVDSQRHMDVREGNLRVVSNGTIKDKGQNALLMLDAKTLASKGRSEYFAEKDRVSGVRFMGNVAYLTDSNAMRVFDLSNPAKPVQVGTIDTFSGTSYLHPYGANRLIGIGTAVENTYVKTPENREKQFGYRDGGVQFSLFDVSDPKTPKVLDTLVIGSNGSKTLASSNPKSLMFDGDKGVMTLPFAYNDFEIVNGEGETDNWNGGVALEIKENEIKLGATFSLGDYYSSADSRFVYIDNVLYYVSAPYLVALDYNSYKILESIPLAY